MEFTEEVHKLLGVGGFVPLTLKFVDYPGYSNEPESGVLDTSAAMETLDVNLIIARFERVVKKQLWKNSQMGFIQENSRMNRDHENYCINFITVYNNFVGRGGS